MSNPSDGRKDAAYDEHGHGPSWLDENDWIVKGLYVLCAISCIAGIPYATEGHYWFEKYVFHAAYGWAGCVLLVVAAAQMRKVLMREEDYYDD